MKHYVLFYTPTDCNAKISSEQLWKYFPLQTKDCMSCYVSPEHLLRKPNVLWSCFSFTVDCVSGTPMALKVLPKASTKLQGFLREYCISLHLSCHPCIVGLFGIAFQSNEHYGFAQELVTGRDLFAIIQPRVGPQTSWDLSFIHM